MTLPTAAARAYAVRQELKTLSKADTAPDRLAVFLRLPCRLPGYAGSAANTTGVRPEYARRRSTVISSRRPSFDGRQSLKRIEP